MDPGYDGFTEFLNGLKADDEISMPNSYQNLDPLRDSEFGHRYPEIGLLNYPLDNLPSPDLGTFVPSLDVSLEGDSFSVSQVQNSEEKSPSNSDDSDFSEPLLKYINQMLMEENIEELPSMFHDPMALKDTERSLYEVIGTNYPSSPSQFQYFTSHGDKESPDSHFAFNSNDFANIPSSSTSTSNSTDSQFLGDAGEYAPSLLPNPPSDNHVSQSSSLPKPQTSSNPPNSFADNSKFGFTPSVDSLLVQNMFSDRESILLFQKGMEEASKFLPDSSKLNLEVNMGSIATGRIGASDIQGSSSNWARKNHEREDTSLEAERSNKQVAFSAEEENELSEMFDKVLLLQPVECGENAGVQNDACMALKPIDQPIGSDGGKTHAKKEGRKEEAVDLRTLLMQCAQSISANDSRTAGELLKQIRQHSSPLGDGTQRLAHYFANALEARLNGSETGFPNFCTAQTFRRTTSRELLQAYQVYMTACPFKKFAIFFANKMIIKVAENATSLHVIDFGISYGYQWPVLIQLLSCRPGGPPKLRITGIELPQRGFRPAESINETGRRLARYCERFGVPFEYKGIASQKWETLRIEDFKIESGEVLAVNCLFRFKNLLDETVVANSPRDAVLRLIRNLKPNIFVNAIVNGSYNVPFFVTRFREALFHYSAVFDMFDNNLPRDSDERLMFEREFYGREAMNAIACEGTERVERPETYKQWQVRNVRAGFKKMPLDQELMKKFRNKLRSWYHKDFVFDENNDWMLQGWRGRILFASSCWVPA